MNYKLLALTKYGILVDKELRAEGDFDDTIDFDDFEQGEKLKLSGDQAGFKVQLARILEPDDDGEGLLDENLIEDQHVERMQHTPLPKRYDSQINSLFELVSSDSSVKMLKAPGFLPISVIARTLIYSAHQLQFPEGTTASLPQQGPTKELQFFINEMLRKCDEDSVNQEKRNRIIFNCLVLISIRSYNPVTEKSSAADLFQHLTIPAPQVKTAAEYLLEQESLKRQLRSEYQPEAKRMGGQSEIEADKIADEIAPEIAPIFTTKPQQIKAPPKPVTQVRITQKMKDEHALKDTWETAWAYWTLRSDESVPTDEHLPKVLLKLDGICRKLETTYAKDKKMLAKINDIWVLAGGLYKVAVLKEKLDNDERSELVRIAKRRGLRYPREWGSPTKPRRAAKHRPGKTKVISKRQKFDSVRRAKKKGHAKSHRGRLLKKNPGQFGSVSSHISTSSELSERSESSQVSAR